MRPHLDFRKLLETLSKSGATSLLGAGSELATLALLHAIGVPLVVAFALVQLVGTTITFTLNKLWVFGAGGSGQVLGEGAKAIIVFAGSMGLNTALPSVGAYGLHLSPLIAYATSQLMVFVSWNFPLNRWWVFPQAIA